MIERTVPRSEECPGAAAGGVPHDRLVFLGHSEQPELVSSVHALDEIDEIHFHRGARSVERRGKVLALAFPDPRMSHDHGRWLRRGARWLLEVGTAKNKAVVDGAVVERAVLDDGALIELGYSFFLLQQSLVEAVPAHLAGDVDADHLPAGQPGFATFAPALARVFEGLVRLAPSPTSVLLVGETGVGKEVVARALHALSGRHGELVAVNCGALPATLVEAELFGHRRGAFTGAAGARLGLVRSAHQGTLFLDEIGELAPAAQAVLLRVLQEREVLPIGEDHPVAVDLRLIAATLRDVEAAAEDGRFRPDLYARLSGHVVELPPLRERREDLGILLAALRARHRPVRLATDALRALLRYGWPRNIRELEQAISTAIALAPGDVVQLEHLPAAIRAGQVKPPEPPPPSLTSLPPSPSPPSLSSPPPPPPSSPPRRTLEAEDLALRARLLELLSQHEGNVVAVAKALGKERSQIYKWVKRLGIDLTAFRPTP